MAKIKTPDGRRCIHFSEKMGCKHLPKECNGMEFDRYCFTKANEPDFIVKTNPDFKTKDDSRSDI